MDSDPEDEDREEMNLAGFLFGNINKKNQLETDVFDDESKRQIASLTKFGLGSILSEVISDNEVETKKDRSNSDDSSSMDDSDEDQKFYRKKKTTVHDTTDYNIKEDSAEDYFDINELAEDLPTSILPPEPSKIEDADDYDIEETIPAAKVTAQKNGDEESIDTESKDHNLMPPPLSRPTTSEDNSSESQKEVKKLDTPLGAISNFITSKYANVDVTELFPDFRQDKVLRFSRLFGPGKFSSLPQIWRSVRRRAKKKRKEKEHKSREQSDSTSDSDEPRRCNGFNLKYAPMPPKERCISDDEDKLLSAVTNEDKEEKQESNASGDSKNKVADWRFGPAQVWYDMLDVPDNGEGFNYGFKLRDKSQEEEPLIKGEPIPDDAYLMVSQLHWEDDVVWDGCEIKNKVLQKLNSKTNAAGWLPSSGSRTAGAFSQPGKSVQSTPSLPSKLLTSSMSKKAQLLAKLQEDPDDTWYSIFPVENEELVYSKWEDDVIWDSEAMNKIPKPKVLTLDPNDENIILGIPDDIDPATIQRNTGPVPKVKIPHPHVKKSKILLGKAGVINVLAEDTPPPPPKSPDRDPFNISNDFFYMAKTSEATLRIKVGGGNLIQHSTPVVELRAPFVPTHMGPMKLRMFHRSAMKKYSHGTMATSAPQPVQPLLKHITKKSKQRELERIASGGGDVFFMRTPEDLTGRDGELILIEFCEEHPPLMNQVGMCSKIKNYYKRKAGKDHAPPEINKYGEISYAHTSPFLGILHPGNCMQVVENNMYRAPIYQHQIPSSDFLIIRNRNSYYVREADGLFVAGQECPLYEVPGPNSKRANNFVRDFLQVFIYRLFWKSRDNPRKIRMDDIKRAFPAHSESSIRKRLKQCADFKRTGMDSNYWVIKLDFRLPSEEEIRAMVSPEQCCAYFSMIAAEQRLKDAGYGEKFIFAQQEDDDEELQLKMDDEVKVAPWNTTRAYIQAMRGKCILQLNGPADPTGCGEGFSYVRMPNKPTQQNKEEQESQPKRTVTGTDADLRRLSLNNAKALLRKFQVPEEDIKKLSRWEIIDVVRTLSTEKAKAGEEGMDKFSRGNRFSIAEHQERYKEECQRVFDLQNRVLASSEVLSTDEGESTASEESDIEELGKNLENMLANKKTSTQLSLEREEQERRELKKIMEDRESNRGNSKKKEEELSQSQKNTSTQILKITRTFKNSEGKEFTRVEVVRRQSVIDAYVKIRNTKDDAFIRQFATLDDAQKEEMKREKRRIQEQLRRIKRNQEKIGMAQQAQQNPHSLPPGIPISLGDRNTNLSQSMTSLSGKEPSSSKENSPSKKKIKMKPDLKLKCGACGQVGHMRTNKACPQYSGMIVAPSLQVALTEEQEEDYEKEMNLLEEDENLVNLDGTKVKLSSKLIKRHEDVKRRTLLLKVPKDAVGRGKRRRMGDDSHCDYLRYHKPANRARTDPIVSLSSILEEILNDMRDMPDVQPFMFPVNAKKVPDYYKHIQHPMDLQSIRENLRTRKYHSREDFLADVNQIVENSTLYNGQNNALTGAATRLLQKCVDGLAEQEEELMRLEKAINPLLDDDDQVALSYVFEKLLTTKLKIMPESWPFLKPVNRKLVKDYYSIIQRPMDLETVEKKISSHKYHSRTEFLSDIQLISHNCEKFNGVESTFTKQAKVLVDFTKKALEEFDIAHLEYNISMVQERARNDAEQDGNWDAEPDDESFDYRQQADRGSSPEDYADLIEPGTSAQVAPPQLPPVKRSRGRPRKVVPKPGEEGWTPKDIKKEKIKPVEEVIDVVGGINYDHLKQDLQFSTDEEDDFENVGIEASTSALEQNEIQADTDMAQTSFGSIGHGDDDSQQAAEAMVQLSGIGFYASQAPIQTQDESMDFDPNNFLMKKEIKQDPYQQQQYQEANDGYEYASEEYNEVPVEHQQQQQQEYYPTSFAQQFAPNDFSGLIQIPEHHETQEEMSAVPIEESGGGGLEDLDISDSDEEPNLKMEIFNNEQNVNKDVTPEDDQGLWF